MEPLLVAVAAWLFGLLTPGVVEAIQQPKQKKRLMAAFRLDLIELRYTAAAVVSRLRARTGTYTTGTAALLKPVIEGYTSTESTVDISATRVLLTQLTPAEFAAAQNSRVGDGSPYPVRYELPFLEAHLADVTLFDIATQQRLFRVRNELLLFNENVEQVRMFHDRTFTIPKDREAANTKNYESGLNILATRGEILIRAINGALGE